MPPPTQERYRTLVEECRAVDPVPIAQLGLELCELWSPPGSEAQVAERLAEELTRVGARVRLDHTFPESPSVIAELGAESGRTLQWHGHLDAIDAPHPAPELTGGRLVGRGSADMKGPDAAMVTAVALLARHGLPDGCRLLITLHGMHESGGNEPLHDLIARGVHGDAVITAELGGGLELPTGGLGLTFWEVQVSRPGTTLHEVMAPPGTVNPVEVGRLVHAELAALRDELAARPGTPPLPSIFVGQFTGGDYVNTVPVTATLKGTRRHDSAMSPDEVVAELQALVDRVSERTGARIDLSAVPVADSFDVDPEEQLVSATVAAHRDLTGRDLPLSRSTVASNAVHFVQEAGIPAVGYGPDPSTNHSDLESVAVDELGRIAGGLALATARYFDLSPDEPR